MIVLEINNQTKAKISKKPLQEALKKAQRVLKIRKKQEVSLAFVTLARMKQINFSCCKKNKPTDVLSFAEDAQGRTKFLGEIIICPQMVETIHELSLQKLLIHGYLHLMGYDHKTKKQEDEMLGLEKAICLALKN